MCKSLISKQRASGVGQSARTTWTTSLYLWIISQKVIITLNPTTNQLCSSYFVSGHQDCRGTSHSFPFLKGCIVFLHNFMRSFYGITTMLLEKCFYVQYWPLNFMKKPVPTCSTHPSSPKGSTQLLVPFFNNPLLISHQKRQKIQH